MFLLYNAGFCILFACKELFSGITLTSLQLLKFCFSPSPRKDSTYDPNPIAIILNVPVKESMGGVGVFCRTPFSLLFCNPKDMSNISSDVGSAVMFTAVILCCLVCGFLTLSSSRGEVRIRRHNA